MGAYKREFSGSNGRPDEFDLVSRDDGDDPDASYEGLENVRGKSYSSHQEQLLITSML